MKQKPKTKGSKSTASRAKSMAAPGNGGSYARTLEEGRGLQEQWMRNMAAMLDRGASMAEWQVVWARWAQTASHAMPLAQRQFEEMMQIVASNSRAGAELLRKTMEATRVPMLLQTQDKWMDIWTTTLRAMQSNAQTLSQVTGRSLTSYIELIRKNIPVEGMVPARG
ncbi:MAG TPA: hypothetical protein VN673_03470 [Clostridia bacterium]|nr:hypothetical protein [Clostridia bacterium]